MTVQERLYTSDDLLNLTHDGKLYALVEGQIIEMAPTGQIHGLLTSQITYLLVGFVQAQGLGRVYGAETGFKLTKNPDTVYGIDVAFVSKARSQSVKESFFEGSPDLAVEVVSPGNTHLEMHEKVRAYFQAGARLVWIVYPKSRTIYVYRTETTVEILKESDVLTGDKVLPGFSVSVESLFAVLKD